MKLHLLAQKSERPKKHTGLVKMFLIIGGKHIFSFVKMDLYAVFYLGTYLKGQNDNIYGQLMFYAVNCNFTTNIAEQGHLCAFCFCYIKLD